MYFSYSEGFHARKLEDKTKSKYYALQKGNFL